MAVNIRSEFPPSPASHSLGSSAVEAFSAIVPALETIFKVILGGSGVEDHQRWTLFEAFQIKKMEEFDPRDTCTSYALEKLQYLNALITTTNYTFSPELLTRLNQECMDWIFNGLQLFTADTLYSSNQLCKTSKSPLYTKTLMSLLGFLVRCSQQGVLSSCVPWIIRSVLHPHFVCNLLGMDVWQFLLQNSQDSLFYVDVVKTLVQQLQKISRSRRLYPLEISQAATFIERTFSVVPETYRVQAIRDLLPSSQQATSLEACFVVWKVVPFEAAGAHLQHALRAKTINLCIQRYQEKVTPSFLNPRHVPLLADIAACCYALLRDEQPSGCPKDLRLRLVEFVLRVLTFPAAYCNHELAATLLRLAVPLRKNFDPEQLESLLDIIAQVVQVNGHARSAAIEFLSKTADIELSRTHKVGRYALTFLSTLTIFV